jgi:hypothetical protein
MARHTPGPWKIGQEYGNNQDEIEAADGRCVAVVWTRKCAVQTQVRECYKPDNELMNNAQLIASAPDLLAALEDITQHAFDDDTPIQDIIADMERMRDIARAAIAKATEPSPVPSA